jgi:hypothetical protein
MTPLDRHRELRHEQLLYIDFIDKSIPEKWKAKLYERIDVIQSEIFFIEKMPYWDLWEDTPEEFLVKEKKF